MNRKHIIALDTHCTSTEIGVMTEGGRMVRRLRCPTKLSSLVEALEAVSGPREVVLEEGPLADWLLRGLTGHADRVTVCNPRRNQLIAKDSDKSDPIDVEKLAHLYRGGFVKPVHHPDSFQRVVFKRHVALYHDAVSERVGQANRIIAEFRHHGIMVQESHFADPAGRRDLLAALPDHTLVRADLKSLWMLYDAAARHVATLKRRLIRVAKQEAQLVRFTALPGVKWIRAATFFAYVDTPWRFKSKSALWKYLGIGLQRRQSGAGPAQVGVPQAVNRRLKSMILGAAKSAIAAGENPFADQYERWTHAGLTPRIARRNVARSQAATMWGMWKNSSAYRPEWVGEADPAGAGRPSGRSG